MRVIVAGFVNLTAVARKSAVFEIIKSVVWREPDVSEELFFPDIGAICSSEMLSALRSTRR
jgi:hypothetical protein